MIECDGLVGEELNENVKFKFLNGNEGIMTRGGSCSTAFYYGTVNFNMGIKARVEVGANVYLSQSQAILWFTAIILSGFLILVLIFIGCGIIQGIIITSIFSLFWLFSLLLFNPVPLYSISLLLIECVVILIVVIRTKFKKPE